MVNNHGDRFRLQFLGLFPLQMAFSWLINGGDPNYVLTNWDDPPSIRVAPATPLLPCRRDTSCPCTWRPGGLNKRSQRTRESNVREIQHKLMQGAPIFHCQPAMFFFDPGVECSWVKWLVKCTQVIPCPGKGSPSSPASQLRYVFESMIFRNLPLQWGVSVR